MIRYLFLYILFQNGNLIRHIYIINYTYLYSSKNEGVDAVKEVSNEEDEKEKEKKKSDKNNRLIFGALGIFLILSIVYLGHTAVALSLFAAQVEIFRELMNVRYKEAREKEIPWFRTINWLIFSISVFYMHFKPISNSFTDVLVPLSDSVIQYHAYLCLLLYAFTFIWFVLSLKQGLIKYQISQLAWTILTIGIVVVQTKSCFYRYIYIYI